MAYLNPYSGGTGVLPEFTPEMNEEYLASILNPLEKEHEKNLGTARREGEAAGLVGQAATGARIGTEEAGYDRNVADTIAGFDKEVAGLKYSERMKDQQELWHLQDQAEQEKRDQEARSFEWTMNQLNLQERRAEQGQENLAAHQGELIGLGSSFLGGIGSGLGRSMGGGK